MSILRKGWEGIGSKERTSKREIKYKLQDHNFIRLVALKAGAQGTKSTKGTHCALNSSQCLQSSPSLV